MSDLELVDCLRADILAAQQQQPEENDSSFYGNRNKINASAEIVALIKGDVDAIFLKVHAAQIAHDFALHTIIDIGSHQTLFYALIMEHQERSLLMKIF